MRILILTPYPLYWRWPTTPDTTRMITNAAPATMPQLAAMLVPGHEVRIFDGNVYRPPLSQFAELVRWADVIGINSMSTYAALNTELNVRFIRRVNPRATVVLGGHHATFYVDQWLQRGAHVVVRHEGEQTLIDLVSVLQGGGDLGAVAGISWLDGDEPRHNPDRPFLEDLDELPMPAWDLVDFSGYDLFLRRNGLAACVETSRGCEHHCRFCQVGPMWKHTHRYKSVRRTVAELDDLHRRGVRQLFVVDDSYGVVEDASRQRAIYDAWGRSGLVFEWGAFLRVDYVLRFPELIAEAAKLGLRYVLVGFESPSETWVKRFGKELDGKLGPADYREAYRILHRNGILVGGFLVIGYPGQTLDDLDVALRRFPEFCDYPIVTLYKPLQGTAGYDDCVAEGQLAKDMFYHDSQAVAVRGTEEFLRYYNKFFARFLLSPSHVKGLAYHRDPAHRDMLRSIYAWFASGLVRANRHNLADFASFVAHPSDTPEQIIGRLTGKYLSDAYLDQLTRPFVAGRRR